VKTPLPQSNIALPVQPAHQLPVRTEAQRWLVTDLWLEHSVGLIGGNEKGTVMRRTVEIRPK